MITPAEPRPPERHEGRELYVWALSEGTAYLLDDVARTTKEIVVDRDTAKRAEYTFILRFVNGHTVAVFEVDGNKLAQPLESGAPAARTSKRTSKRTQSVPRLDRVTSHKPPKTKRKTPDYDPL